MANTYLRELARVFLASPANTEEEDLLDRALDLACARHGVDAGEILDDVLEGNGHAIEDEVADV